MKFTLPPQIGSEPKKDNWIWGSESILWGFEPKHRFTVKVLEPKAGRLGCLSLQYHKEKEETWIPIRGVAWALVVIDGVVCTRILRPGDVQNVKVGTLHRLMGVTDDVMILEPSTIDAHAVDKSAVKDVIRLHCTLGRQVSEPADPTQADIVKRCVEVTELAIDAIEKGQCPDQVNAEHLLDHGAYKIPI